MSNYFCSHSLMPDHKEKWTPWEGKKTMLPPTNGESGAFLQGDDIYSKSTKISRQKEFKTEGPELDVSMIHSKY